MTGEELKKAICEKAYDLGANLIRFCSVSKWEEQPIQAPEFWPQNIWPWVRNIIVLGIPLYAPMMETTPSMVYQELYDTSNRVLDDMAYHLSNYISSKLGYKAIFFPRDCYYNIEVLVENPNAAFSHVIAGYYAGMGSIGDSHNLLTKEFGPRLRIVSILTDAQIPADEMQEHNLCLHCGKCLRNCPSHCFTKQEKGIYEMDKRACTEYHVKLKGAHHWPCGICAGVCPVGEDRKLYQGSALATQEGIRHCQNYGS